MSKNLLEISNLSATVAGVHVLKGLNLSVGLGEVHAIMGPNGAGKSTLTKVLAGDENYHVDEGKVGFQVDAKEVDLLSLEIDERAREGIFIGNQYPVEVPGVSNFKFLHACFNAQCEHHGVERLNDAEFREFVEAKVSQLSFDPSFLDRQLNVDYSGGEKKRNEILQMAVLNPRLAILDETDSGLDVDSMKLVAKGINQLRSDNNAVVLITHYQRLLDHVVPDFVHILVDGKIVKSGDKSLALKVENEGYDWLN